MCKYILIAIVTGFLSSCATLMNDRKTEVLIHATKPVTIIHQTDTVTTDKITLRVKRSVKPLRLTVISDSLRKEIAVPARLSKTFYLNAFPPLVFGFAIDAISQKGYTYRGIELDENLNHSRIKKQPYYSNKKGDFHLAFTVPLLNINQVSIVPDNTQRSSFGTVFGYAGSLEYVYKDNRSINLAGGGTFGRKRYKESEQLDYLKNKNSTQMCSFSLTHNHHHNRFTYGYGLSYAYYDWWSDKYNITDNNLSHNYYLSYAVHRKKSRYSTIGFAFNGYYNIYKAFNFGLVYKPSVMRLKPVDGKRFMYEHQIAFDFQFKFRFRK